MDTGHYTCCTLDTEHWDCTQEEREDGPQRDQPGDGGPQEGPGGEGARLEVQTAQYSSLLYSLASLTVLYCPVARYQLVGELQLPVRELMQQGEVEMHEMMQPCMEVQQAPYQTLASVARWRPGYTPP